MLSEGFAIVADIGKTHSRLSLYARGGELLGRKSRANARQPADPYAPLDTAAVADWLIAALADFAAYPVEAIIPVAHGAAVAGIRGGMTAFLPPDYEWEIPPECLAEYRAQRDDFAITGSPVFPGGLNIGSQLHYLEALDAAGFRQTTLLPYAQYWAWLLSGVAVSEVTSLGCHSDLWSPAKASFSPMAMRRGWSARFAPLARAGDAIGRLLPEIAARTGLSPEVRIHAGLHDSNAALVAARGFAEIAGRDATVLSTGTWFVALRSPGQSPAKPADLAALPEGRDCLVNVDVWGQTVPSARFMGGREIELLGGAIDRAGSGGVAEVLASGAMVLPALVPGSGPFPQHSHRWIAEPAAPEPRRAAIALYAALMADAALELIGAQDVLLIEGRFAASEVFTRALAALRPGMAVYCAPLDCDASFGALRLIAPDLPPAPALRRVEPLPGDLARYRAAWREFTGTSGR